MRMNQRDIDYFGLSLGYTTPGGNTSFVEGLYQIQCQKPSRFRLPVVMARLLATVDILPDKSSFFNTEPARPFPDSSPPSRFVIMMVDACILLIAAFKGGAFVATMASTWSA